MISQEDVVLPPAEIWTHYLSQQDGRGSFIRKWKRYSQTGQNVRMFSGRSTRLLQIWSDLNNLTRDVWLLDDCCEYELWYSRMFAAVCLVLLRVEALEVVRPSRLRPLSSRCSSALHGPRLAEWKSVLMTCEGLCLAARGSAALAVTL